MPVEHRRSWRHQAFERLNEARSRRVVLLRGRAGEARERIDDDEAEVASPHVGTELCEPGRFDQVPAVVELQHRGCDAGQRHHDDRAGLRCANRRACGARSIQTPLRLFRVLLPEREQHAPGFLDAERAEPRGSGRDGDRELTERHGLARAALSDELADLAERKDAARVRPAHVAKQPGARGRTLRVPRRRHVDGYTGRRARLAIHRVHEARRHLAAHRVQVAHVLAFAALAEANGRGDVAQAVGHLASVPASRLVLVGDDHHGPAGENFPGQVGDHAPLARAPRVAGGEKAVRRERVRVLLALDDEHGSVRVVGGELGQAVEYAAHTVELPDPTAVAVWAPLKEPLAGLAYDLEKQRAALVVVGVSRFDRVGPRFGRLVHRATVAPSAATVREEASPVGCDAAGVLLSCTMHVLAIGR
ncbi:MAG TPA: hypothetical protein VE987_10110, partial [Polyangiaceae bacterium]|nr:hypothetical protein [Polyangiaceae bacterium]